MGSEHTTEPAHSIELLLLLLLLWGWLLVLLRLRLRLLRAMTMLSPAMWVLGLRAVGRASEMKTIRSSRSP